jgi:hypothetical protein
MKPKECNAEINKTKSKICQPKKIICVDRLKNKYMKNKKITDLTKKKYGETTKMDDYRGERKQVDNVNKMIEIKCKRNRISNLTVEMNNKRE